MNQNTCKFMLLLVFSQLTFMSFAEQFVFGNTDDLHKNLDSNVYKNTLSKLKYFDSIQQDDSLKFYILQAKRINSRIDTLRPHNRNVINIAAQLHSFIAVNAFKNDKLSDALVEFTHSENLYRFLKNKTELAGCLNNKAVIYSKSGGKVEALIHYHKTIAIFIELKDSFGIATGHNNLAKIYRQQEDFENARNSLEIALNIARQLNHPLLLTRVIITKAGLRKDIGDLDGALSLYQEALSLTNSVGNEIVTSQVLNNLGVVYLETKEYTKAKEYFDRTYEIVKRNNFLEGQAFALSSLGKYYFELNNFEKAIKVSVESLEIGIQIGNDEITTKSIQLLLEIYEIKKDWEKAFFYQGLLIEQKIKHEQNDFEQVTQQETIRLKLENDRFIAKNNRIEENLILEKKDQQQNLFYYGLGFVFLLLLTALFIIYSRLRASREKNKYITKQSEERKLLLQEVHHRVKNNFQIVSSMLRLQSYNFDNEELRINFEEAVNRINAMAIVHDVIYRQEKFKDINSKTYLEKLVLSLHKTGDSRIVITVESEEIPFKIETLINLGIALNELITNSFKHAFTQAIDQPKIHISLRTIGEKKYELNYKDNGIGIKKNSYTSNFGMDLIETIIDNFEGEVILIDDLLWNTAIRITFKEF